MPGLADFSLVPALFGALVLPWLLTAWCLAARSRHETQVLSALGYGWLLITLGETLWLRVWSRILDAPLDWPFPWLSLCAALLLALLILRFSPHTPPSTLNVPNHSDRLTMGVRWLLGIFCLWLLLRYGPLLLEIIWRPLFAWDAWATWSHKTRVWFDQGALTAFVSPEAWMSGGWHHAYTTLAFGYPELLPLLQLWTLSAIGHWDESLMNLAWWGAALSLGAMLIAEARRAAMPLGPALFGAYIVLSLPMLNTHVALAGYADLWVAAFLFATVTLTERGLRERNLGTLLLAAVLALGLLTTKQESKIYLLGLLLALVWSHWPGRLKIWIATGLTLGLLGLMSWGLSWQITPEQSLQLGLQRIVLPWVGQFSLGYRPIGADLLNHLLFYENWNLLWFLVGATLLAAPLLKPTPATRHWRLLMLGLGGPLLFACFFTEVSAWVIQGTTVNRVLLHLAPVASFWVLREWWDWHQAELTDSNCAPHPLPESVR